MNHCTACGEPIRWERTRNGKPIPLDAHPTPDGNVLRGKMAGQDCAEVLSGGPLEDAREHGADLYMPHHATCTEWGKI